MYQYIGNKIHKIPGGQSLAGGGRASSRSRTRLVGHIWHLSLWPRIKTQGWTSDPRKTGRCYLRTNRSAGHTTGTFVTPLRAPSHFLGQDWYPRVPHPSMLPFGVCSTGPGVPVSNSCFLSYFRDFWEHSSDSHLWEITISRLPASHRRERVGGSCWGPVSVCLSRSNYSKTSW